ncbi:hypothetical protein D4765_18400 [Subtercola vilae]|uniref:Uncharacterized protein n=1 Tax=Subtercola vilae TaxID=2056433 RepID=A0A4T2BFV4_9MICO|nr:hypothetical protein D4765_18400 [Subtercola vilae]
MWIATQQIREQLSRIREQGNLEDIAPIETIGFYIDHLLSFRLLADNFVALFSRVMLDQVLVPLGAVVSSLTDRTNTGTVHPYMDNAASQAEDILVPMAPFPRPYGKGGQVTQMETLFENLLLRQRESVEQLNTEHQNLRGEVETFSVEVSNSKDSSLIALQQIEDAAKEIAETITGEKARIDAVVQDGIKAVAAMETENTDRYKAWRAEREAAFRNDFRELKASMEADLGDAHVALDELRRVNQQYENLAALGAGDLIASNFAVESKWGRLSGLVLYGVGFLFLIAAAIPLIFFLFENPNTPDGSPDWGRLIVRISIGVLAGSAATVVIRLGARLIANANASKRMELELRSFGPFLANVTDTDTVDGARLQLLDRAFGKSYVVVESGEKDDVIQVSTFAQIIDAVSKLAK